MRYRDDAATQTYCVSLLRAATVQWLGAGAAFLLNINDAPLNALALPALAAMTATGWVFGHSHRCPGATR